MGGDDEHAASEQERHHHGAAAIVSRPNLVIAAIGRRNAPEILDGKIRKRL